MIKISKKIIVLLFSIALLWQLPMSVLAEDNFIMNGNWVTEGGVAGVRAVTSNITEGYTAEVVYYTDNLEEVQTTPIAINESVFVPNENDGKSCTIYIIDLDGRRVKGASFTPGIIIGDYGRNIEVVNCKTVHFRIWGYATRANVGKLMVRPAGVDQGFETYKTFTIGSRTDSDGYDENYYDGNFDVPENSEVYVFITSEDGTFALETDKVITGKCPAQLKYTVTYTDGLDGIIFKDDVHPDITKGAQTPEFSGGTPIREGYKFLGWSPKVANNVKKDAVYTAQWEKIASPTNRTEPADPDDSGDSVNTNNTKTSDNNNMASSVLMITLSAIGIAFIVKHFKKKTYN